MRGRDPEDVTEREATFATVWMWSSCVRIVPTQGHSMEKRRVFSCEHRLLQM